MPTAQRRHLEDLLVGKQKVNYFQVAEMSPSVPQCLLVSPPVRHNTGQDAGAEEQSVSLASRARRTLIVAEILMTQDCQLSDGPGC